MLTIEHIREFALLHANIAYILIFIGMVLEGEIVVILAGIFAHLGSISIFPALLAILIGGAVKSVLGYSFGFYLNKMHSHRRCLIQAERRINRFLPSFMIKTFISIFLSRFLIFGLYWFALIYAGYKKIDLKTFIKAEIASLLAWSFVMMFLGYSFSYAALSISRDVRKFIGIIILFFIGFFVLEKILTIIIKLFENKNKPNVNF
jgi:membrane protein DedA with SNARE-associated domain